MPNDISTLRLGMPGAGILGRVSGRGPPQLLQASDLFKLGVQPTAFPAQSAKVSGKWAAPITFTFTGDVTGSVTFDGSANESIPLTLAAPSPTVYGPLMNGDTAPSGVIVAPDGSAILVPL